MGFQTLSPRKGIIPYPEGKKRLIRQPPHKKKLKNIWKDLIIFLTLPIFIIKSKKFVKND